MIEGADTEVEIRVEIVNGDSQITDNVFNHPYHPTLIGTDTIHHDAANASCIVAR